MDNHGELSRWLLEWFSTADGDEREAMIQAIYGLWLARNSARDGKRIDQPHEIMELEAPEDGWVKINSDGAVHKGGSKAGGGAVLRDHNGAFLAGVCHHFPHIVEPEAAEILACKRALHVAEEINVQNVHLELDCLPVVPMINQKGINYSGAGPWIQEIKQMLALKNDYKVTWVKRTALMDLSLSPSVMASTSSTSELPDGVVLVPAPDPLVHVAFNQHGTHFVAAMATGFHVFSCHPLESGMHRRSSELKVTSAQLLTRSQLAVATRRPSAVSGAVDDHVIDFWNGMCKPKDARTNTVRSPCGAVGGFRLRGDHMLVAGEGTATLFDGVHWEKEVRRRGRAGSVSVCAHGSGVACLALSRDGRLLATAGTRGTLVRIFSTADGTKLQELRRGTEGADIHCIAFSHDSKWLAVSSDKATVHVFSINDFNLTSSTLEEDHASNDILAAPLVLPSSPAPATTNQSSSRMSFLKGYLPTYFSSKWSFAQFRIPNAWTKCSVAFDRRHPNTITIVCMDKRFYRCEFDPVKGGDMVPGVYHENFMDL
ncbi:autophagy-related protein 18d-like [Aegilops tauschii subsp. strangulata]|uniref:autophagy-related protein 18d-like n=1 Tax=Aegilops tauschii subsp. strangulata TaxID=200361 RepID=UPI003CC8D477